MERKDEVVEAIKAHFLLNCPVNEAPAHWEKDEDDLIDMVGSGVITADHFKTIKAFKASSGAMPVDAHMQLIEELITVLSPKKRNTELKGKDIYNNFVISKLGMPWRKVDAAVSCTKFIKEVIKMNPRSFRATVSTPDEMYKKFVEAAKGEDKLKKVLGKMYQDANEAAQERAKAKK